ncbi:MAG: TIGR03960 family B12-binding radical SAM protein [Clostridia bacterium]|nr:TIGR03960 family B12-binding radical SAM protein [Clostridia bacterium]
MINIDALLKKVQKPARYVGGELNSYAKDVSRTDIRYGFCFPDTYDVGLCHLGMKILYEVLNLRDDTFCERFFAPWTDMEQEMRAANVPLFSLETHTPAAEFDFLGFTLQYEMSYTNILNMLDLGGVPIFAKDRGEDAPFVNAGGPCAYNPEPLAEFFDFFTFGEGEEVINELMDEYAAWKKRGGKRIEYLRAISKIEGIYVPSFYDVEYNEDFTLRSMAPRLPEAGYPIPKRIIADLDNVVYPKKFIVPYSDIIHDRVSLEVFRGCIRGCRFCQAGMIYRPVREKSPETLVADAKAIIDATGYEEIGLLSLSTSDYTRLEQLTDGLLEFTEGEHIGLSLPSLRVDNFSLDLLNRVQKVRKSGLTFAPEAGTQRMRDVINKNVTEEDLLHSATLAFQNGYNTIKLYFMIGLPYETNEDIEGIAHLAQAVVSAYYAAVPKGARRGVQVNISVSSFVPKPFTPFQWARQNTPSELRKKQQLLKNTIRSKQIKYSYHESDVSVLEGVFARGDRRLCAVLYEAWRRGCKLDSWSETFRMDKWLEAFSACGIDMEFYTRERGADERFPWEICSVGVSREFLARENEKARNGETTPNCREKCSACGAAALCEGGKCCV